MTAGAQSSSEQQRQTRLGREPICVAGTAGVHGPCSLSSFGDECRSALAAGVGGAGSHDRTDSGRRGCRPSPGRQPAPAPPHGRTPAAHRGERPPTITEMLTHTPSDCARNVLQTIVLQAQSLTGSELAAAGIDGDATHPFSIWAHVGMPPEQVEQIGRIAARRRAARADRARKPHGAAARRPAARRLQGPPPHHPPITSFLAYRSVSAAASPDACASATSKAVASSPSRISRWRNARRTRDRRARRGAGLRARDSARAWLQTGARPDAGRRAGPGQLRRCGVDNDALRSFIGAKTSVNGTLDPRTIHMSRPSGDRLPSEELPVMRAVTDGEVTVGREFVVRGPDDRSGAAAGERRSDPVECRAARRAP